MNKKQYERYLNDLYSEQFSIDDIISQLGYLSSDKIIYKNYINHTLGRLLRYKDPIAFNVGYNDYKEHFNY